MGRWIAHSFNGLGSCVSRVSCGLAEREAYIWLETREV